MQKQNTKDEKFKFHALFKVYGRYWSISNKYGKAYIYTQQQIINTNSESLIMFS